MACYNRALRKFVSPEFITGEDARLFAGRYCLNFNLKKVLLVTDLNIERCPWMTGILDSLSDSGVEFEIFSSVSENPDAGEVMLGADLFASSGCYGIVAVGGGSVLDCAKGIGIVAENGGHISDYIGLDLVKNPMPPLICIPSTAGSSADVSQYAVISDRSLKMKWLIISKSLVPDVSLLDPRPLATLSPEVAVYSAIDALTHAIEGYCSNGSSPVTDTFALNSVSLIIGNMSQDYWRDPEKSFGMMLASLYAGLSFSNAGLGLIHSMSHSLGGLSGMNHGLASYMVSGEVISFNYPAVPEKFRILAELFGFDPDCEDADRGIDSFLYEMIGSLFGLREKPSLSDVGIGISDVPWLVERAMEDPCVATNPRIPDRNDVEEMYMKIL